MPCAVGSGADLQSTPQLPIPCYASTSHITDNHYLSHHPPLAPPLARRVPPAMNKGRRLLPLQHSLLESNPVPKPDITGGLCGRILSTHVSPKPFLSSPQTLSPVRSLPLQKNAQNDLERRLPPGPPRTSAPPDPGQPVAGACPRSPHTSLRRIFSSHPQPGFRPTMRLRAS